MAIKQSKFELLRILSMFAIVIHHLIAKNAFNIDIDIYGVTYNKLVLQVIGNLAFIANDLFFLISAYYLSKKVPDLDYSFKSILKMGQSVWFYGCVFGLGSLICSKSISLIVKSFFPLISGLWWYPTTYAIFLLIWPFYHSALSQFSDLQIKRFIAIAFALWSASTIIPFADLGASNLNGFLILYACIVYIKRREIKFDGRIAIVGIAALLIAIASIISLDLLGMKFGYAAKYSCYFLRGNYRPVSLLLSLCVFLWALTWQLQSKVINVIGSLTFDVYLIHMYPPIMNWLFKKQFVLEGVIDSWFAIPWSLAVALAIFTLACIIACFRKILFCFAMRLLRR